MSTKHAEHCMASYCKHNLQKTRKAATSFIEGKNEPSKEKAVTFSSAFLSSFFKCCCNQQNSLIIYRGSCHKLLNKARRVQQVSGWPALAAVWLGTPGVRELGNERGLVSAGAPVE